MVFELSRDYKRAFELIKKGDRIVCLLDYESCRDSAIARCYKSSALAVDLIIGARGITYAFFFPHQIKTSETFEKECDRLNAEFYLPLPDNMLVISAEKAEEIATKVLSRKVRS